MKAIVCENYAPIDQLKFTEIADPVPQADEVLVAIKAAGVNFPDALLVQGLYQDKPTLPFTPGIEFAGDIVEIGNQVNNFAVGTRVLGFNPGYGAYAEKIACPATNVIPIPDTMPYVDAANLVCAFATAQHALKQRGRLKPGETLLVLGAAGGTGSAAVQIGKTMGAHVIAACSNQEKLDFAKSLGADALVNYRAQDLKTAIKELTGSKGVDVVYDPVGGETFDICNRCMARNGRLLVIGFASGVIPKLPMNLPLVKEYSVVGVFWGSFTRHEPAVFAENMRELFRWYGERRIRVITDTEFALEQAVTALSRMIQRGVKGKIVLLP